MFKKIFLSMLLMLVCIPVFAANDVTFYYDSERVEEMWITRVDSNETRSAHPYLLKKRGDNTYIYCLEAFTLMQNDSKYIYDSNYTKYGLTKEDIDRINLIIYYGYGYKNHTSDKWYGITQYLIWKITEKNADVYFSKERYGSKVNLYVEEINEIESLIKEHNTKPNFIKDYIISSNSNLVIDSNIDLSNYNIESNAEYVLDNNKLYFNNLEVGNYNVKLIRKNNRFNNDYMLYYSSESQNVIIPGNSEIYNNEYSFNIKVEEGTVELTKKNEDNEYLEGAKYGIYHNSELITELITDDRGYASTKLPFGEYILKEIDSPMGYELDTKEYTFIIDKDNKEIKFNLTDSKIYVEVVISKKSTYNNKYLENAVYGIYSDNKLINKVITTDKEIVIKLPYGIYKVKELNAPAGYKLDDTEYELTIDNKSNNVKLNLYDDKIVVNVPDTGIKEKKVFYVFFIIGIIGLIYGKKNCYMH